MIRAAPGVAPPPSAAPQMFPPAGRPKYLETERHEHDYLETATMATRSEKLADSLAVLKT